jgi:hypothetical protein
LIFPNTQSWWFSNSEISFKTHDQGSITKSNTYPTLSIMASIKKQLWHGLRVKVCVNHPCWLCCLNLPTFWISWFMFEGLCDYVWQLSVTIGIIPFIVWFCLSHIMHDRLASMFSITLNIGPWRDIFQFAMLKWVPCNWFYLQYLGEAMLFEEVCGVGNVVTFLCIFHAKGFGICWI